MPDDRYEALRAALPGVMPGPWALDPDEHYVCGNAGSDAAYIVAADPTTVRALLDERDAWRALGREQMAECAVSLDEGCSFCRAIADLLGEEPTDA